MGRELTIPDPATLRRVYAAVLWVEEQKRSGKYQSIARDLPSEVVQMRLKVVYNDYLVCRTWDGTTEGSDDIKVAKPFELRTTPKDGKTISGIAYAWTGVQARTLTQSSPSVTENQVIVPTYQVAVTNYEGDLIYATQPANGTAVTVGEEKLTWLDTNNGGRAWSKATS